jgi:hypothetical protein
MITIHQIHSKSLWKNKPMDYVSVCEWESVRHGKVTPTNNKINTRRRKYEKREKKDDIPEVSAE